MDEHDDDTAPEVEEGVEFEVAEYPALAEGEDDSDESMDDEDELQIDPDTSEI
jgi:hypothetical protein